MCSFGIAWCAISWEAFATIFTGLAAVVGASVLGIRQLKITKTQHKAATQQEEANQQLKQQELRIALLERRADCISEMRQLNDVWLSQGMFGTDEWPRLASVLNNASLLFPDDIISDIDSLLKHSLRQTSYSQRSQYYFKIGKDQKGQEFLEKMFAAEDETIQIMPEIVERLVEHTRVKDWEK